LPWGSLQAPTLEADRRPANCLRRRLQILSSRMWLRKSIRIWLFAGSPYLEEHSLCSARGVAGRYVELKLNTRLHWEQPLPGKIVFQSTQLLAWQALPPRHNSGLGLLSSLQSSSYRIASWPLSFVRYRRLRRLCGYGLSKPQSPTR
jgi:hypothetical protein